MTNELMPNKQPECFTPNAPIKYATAGGRGVLIGCGIIGLCLGYSWSSLFLPFLPFIIIGVMVEFPCCIWKGFKKFYNLGYDKECRI